MKKLVLLMILWPAGVVAQDTTTQDTAAGMQSSDAIFKTIDAGKAVACGIRDAEWARGVYAVTLAEQAAALEVLDKHGNTPAQDVQKWWVLANNMTIAWNLSQGECGSIANDTKKMGTLDKLSLQGNDEQ